MCVALLAALCATAPAASGTGAGAWNRNDQRVVVRKGLIGTAPDGRFHGDHPLGVGAMRHALTALAARRRTVPVPVPSGKVTVQRFHALLLRQLGLAEVAGRFGSEARRAGLRPPRRFGTEVVARLLSLRYNHPPDDDRLERLPWDQITRAEAAYTLARVARLDGREGRGLDETAGRFVLPRFTTRQRAALRVAVAKIGMPYVWGGETDGPSVRHGGQVRGGYDCSGFIWRVFKLSGQQAGRRIRGRTAAQMAGEVPKDGRITDDRIRPADLLFFGPARFRGPATEPSITHSAIALSRDFVIQSSHQGVYVAPLEERIRSFSWARRVL